MSHTLEAELRTMRRELASVRSVDDVADRLASWGIG
jgi:hypothetical protein